MGPRGPVGERVKKNVISSIYIENYDNVADLFRSFSGLQGLPGFPGPPGPPVSFHKATNYAEKIS